MFIFPSWLRSAAGFQLDEVGVDPKAIPTRERSTMFTWQSPFTSPSRKTVRIVVPELVT